MDNVLPEIRSRVDPQRYAGRWFELARSRGIPFEPPGMTDVCTEYTWDGRRMQVRNVGLLDERVLDWRADARPLDDTNARFRLAVSVDSRQFDVLYRILDVDADYQWALVAGDDRNQWVWLLARERDHSAEWWRDKLTRVQDRFGVDFRRLTHTKHTRDEPLCSPAPSVDTQPAPRASASVRRLPNGDYVVETV